MTIGDVNAERSMTVALESGAKHLTGKDYLKKVISNLANNILTQFHRVQATFEACIWIDDQHVLTNFLNEVHSLNKNIENQEVRTEVVEKVKLGAEHMIEICGILKKGGIGQESIEKVGKGFTELLSSLEKSETVSQKSDRSQKFKESEEKLVSLKKQLVKGEEELVLTERSLQEKQSKVSGQGRLEKDQDRVTQEIQNDLAQQKINVDRLEKEIKTLEKEIKSLKEEGEQTIHRFKLDDGEFDKVKKQFPKNKR